MAVMIGIPIFSKKSLRLSFWYVLTNLLVNQYGSIGTVVSNPNGLNHANDLTDRCSSLDLALLQVSFHKVMAGNVPEECDVIRSSDVTLT